MKSTIIGILLLASGVFFGLLGMGQMTVLAHLHEPPGIMLDLPQFESAVEHDPRLRERLDKEKAVFHEKVMVIWKAHFEGCMFLGAAGAMQILAGLLLGVKTRRRGDNDGGGGVRRKNGFQPQMNMDERG